MTDDTIHVAVDHEFRIPLESIGTAGYLWKVESLPEAIQLLGSENEKPAGDTKPGDSTTQIFRFRALKVGKHVIMFALARPWEITAIESHTVTVNAS